jgi:hypothetical protein
LRTADRDADADATIASPLNGTFIGKSTNGSCCWSRPDIATTVRTPLGAVERSARAHAAASPAASTTMSNWSLASRPSARATPSAAHHLLLLV